jgi:hypothetical protein
MRALAFVPLLALGACAPDFRPASRHLGAGLEPRESFVQRRTSYFDAANTRVRREWSYEVLPNGAQRPHGRDVQNYSDGTREYEREFAHGEPTGRWRSWWPDGKPRMEAEYGTKDAQPMRWWHATGELEAEGLALHGVKSGPWRHFRADGTLEAEGEYAAGQRSGPWNLYDERGELAERVEYRRGVRVKRLDG